MCAGRTLANAYPPRLEEARHSRAHTRLAGREYELTGTAVHLLHGRAGQVKTPSRISVQQSAQLFRADSMASLVPITIVLDTIITIGTCTVLARKLRKTKDLFHVSHEIQRAGIWTLACFGKHPVKPTVGKLRENSSRRQHSEPSIF